MRDIDYFSEGKMNSKIYILFKKSLPLHLQIFLAEYNIRDKVIQGYRGPPALVDGSSGDSDIIYPSNGVQEIRYWYATSKNLNILPVAGWVAFGLQRAFEDCDWHSIYFDESTGEALSTNRSDAEKIIKERIENEEKKQKEKEKEKIEREKAEKERLEKEKQERINREEQEARRRAEQIEREAREKAERIEREAREKIERETAEIERQNRIRETQVMALEALNEIKNIKQELTRMETEKKAKEAAQKIEQEANERAKQIEHDAKIKAERIESDAKKRAEKIEEESRRRVEEAERRDSERRAQAWMKLTQEIAGEKERTALELNELQKKLAAYQQRDADRRRNAWKIILEERRQSAIKTDVQSKSTELIGITGEQNQEKDNNNNNQNDTSMIEEANELTINNKDDGDEDAYLESLIQRVNEYCAMGDHVAAAAENKSELMQDYGFDQQSNTYNFYNQSVHHNA